MYYQSTHDPVVLEHILEKAASVPDKQVENDILHLTTLKHTISYRTVMFTSVQPVTAQEILNFSNIWVCTSKMNMIVKIPTWNFIWRWRPSGEVHFLPEDLMTAFHHRQHRWVHYGDHPYICVVTGCGARFDTTNELIAHKP